MSTVHDVHAVAARHGIAVRSAEPLGAGLDNTAILLNGDLVVRFADDGRDVGREVRVLRTVAGLIDVPVPGPEFVDDEARCFAYRLLPGVPTLRMPPGETLAHRGALLRTLTRVLRDLHAAPVGRFDVDVDDDPLLTWLAEARESAQATEFRDHPFFTREPPPRGTVRVFSHCDLGLEHVLVDPRTWEVTGIIDWTDAAICDPAYDYGLLLRDLGPFELPADLRERAWFYARCTVFEDLAYGGLHAVNAKRAAQWLFTPTGAGPASGRR